VVELFDRRAAADALPEPLVQNLVVALGHPHPSNAGAFATPVCRPSTLLATAHHRAGQPGRQRQCP
jgi:hypothetical protein